MAEETPKVAPAPKAPAPRPGASASSPTSGLDAALKLAKAPLAIAKAIINPLNAPKVIMEHIPGGAGALGCLKGAMQALSFMGKVLTNPTGALTEMAGSLAQGKLSGTDLGGGGAAGTAAKGGKLAGKAAEGLGTAIEAGAKAGGTALMGFGKAVQAVPILGQIVGIPMVVGGQGMKVTGTVAGKSIKVAGKVAAKVSTLAEKFGKVMRPVLKVAKGVKKVFKGVRKTARFVASPIKGAQRIGDGIMSIGKVQDHAAKGDVAAAAKSAKSAASGIAGGMKHTATGGGAFKRDPDRDKGGPLTATGTKATVTVNECYTRARVKGRPVLRKANSGKRPPTMFAHIQQRAALKGNPPPGATWAKAVGKRSESIAKGHSAPRSYTGWRKPLFAEDTGGRKITCWISTGGKQPTAWAGSTTGAEPKQGGVSRSDSGGKQPTAWIHSTTGAVRRRNDGSSPQTDSGIELLRAIKEKLATKKVKRVGRMATYPVRGDSKKPNQGRGQTTPPKPSHFTSLSERQKAALAHHRATQI